MSAKEGAPETSGSKSSTRSMKSARSPSAGVGEPPRSPSQPPSRRSDKAPAPSSSSKRVEADEPPPPPPSKRTPSKEAKGMDYAAFIDAHYERRGPGLRRLPYNENELFALLDDALVSFGKQATLIDVRAPIIICGDIHGQFNDLITMLLTLGTPPTARYLFLGDYVDCGQMSVECICLLLAYKVLYPEHVYLLRGNHECSRINKVYGLFDECTQRFGKLGRRLWTCLQKVFDMMPISALVDERILCMHGGLSPTWKTLDELRCLAKPIRNPTRGIVNDLLWSDPAGPATRGGWRPNRVRRTSFTFGEHEVRDFCKTNRIDLVVRAHQLCVDGFIFFAKTKMLTIFSAPAYCGLNNAGAALVVSRTRDGIAARIVVFKPDRPCALPTDDNDDN